MPIKVTINDNASAMLEAVAKVMNPDSISKVTGRAVANTIRANFQTLEDNRPNKQGFPRQHFWSACRRATQAPAPLGSGRVLIEINKPGAALRRFGGTVRPVNKKYLTIPAIAEAYGRRAPDIAGLEFLMAMTPQGHFAPALVQLDAEAKAAGRKKAFRTGQGTVFYWLVRQTKHKPDPSVMPTDEQMSLAAEAAAVMLLESRFPGGVETVEGE